MMLHHDKHHAAYVAALNTALEEFPELQERTAVWLLLNLGKVPEKIRAAVHHNAGGHVNHSLFWRAMSPKGDRTPTGALADAIKRDFGGFAQFKARFDDAGAKLFASGWVWLARAQKDGGKLEVTTTSGHDNPLMQGRFPLLVNDVWEHAYYRKHENRRAEYLNGWWSVANWKEAAVRFEHSDHSAEESWESEGGSLLETTM
jgi:Fe-Mn family superoxide dismutase